MLCFEERPLGQDETKCPGSHGLKNIWKSRDKFYIMDVPNTYFFKNISVSSGLPNLVMLSEFSNLGWISCLKNKQRESDFC